MWISLLEKAYAKMHGGYFNLDKINKSPFEALSDFTGLPVTLYELKPNFFKQLVALQQDGCLLTAVVSGCFRIEEVLERENKLLPGHTYTIMQVRNLFGHKMLQIRNIWGGFIWDGAWSRKSAFWSQEMLDIFKKHEDDSFWMSWDDFLKHFAAIAVLKTQT